MALRTRGGGAPEPVYAVRHLERVRLGTAYPAVVERLVTLFAGPPLAGGTLVVDATGVGRPVVDLLRQARLNARLVPVTITFGRRIGADGSGGWRVPKAVLVTELQRVLRAGRLHVAGSLPFAEALVRELGAFAVRITAARNEVFATAGAGQHDDLVLAVALAIVFNQS